MRPRPAPGTARIASSCSVVRMCRALPFLAAVGLTACAGTGAQSLSGPTPATSAPASAAPAATAIIIATTSLTPSTFQLSATARLSIRA